MAALTVLIGVAVNVPVSDYSSAAQHLQLAAHPPKLRLTLPSQKP
jgi:hypothetical protein